MYREGSRKPRTVVLIHGLWMTPRSWEGWVERYEQRGHSVLAPAWPGMEVDLEELRRGPPAVADLAVTDIVDHYDRIVRGLDSPPIIMGHSFGGTFTQILLDRGLGAAGVAIHPAPVKGVGRRSFAALRAAFPALKNPANRKRTVALTPKRFHYTFANSLTAEQALAVYERQHVPGPGRLLFQAATANLSHHAPTAVDFRNSARAPLLVVGGGSDRTVPVSLSRETADRHSASTAVTDYTEFPGRTHYTLGQEGWEEVADEALDWATALARTAAPTPVAVART